ncbi:MAG: L-seryl-tRNA(Sec) selenium transferase [Planctomycetota bacterium]
MRSPSSLLRNIPSVNELLESPPLREAVDRASRSVVVNSVRGFLDRLRQDLREATADMPIPSASDLASKIADWIAQEHRPTLRPVINATGILLHTGLGRAPLADEAVTAVQEIARGYASVELDLETGERSQRVVAVESLLCQLTGAEAAVVVNNNAAATLLSLAAMAAQREVIVSRGHLIEIGGSYRLPDVMTASGTRLREVGTTNKTRLSDFADAMGPETGALLRVHPSNYVICGFTEQPTLAELVQLGQRHKVPVIDDIGSGALIDFHAFGLTDEPVAAQSIQAGADLCLFSGDKLLGGPHCGIVVGRKACIERLARHPLMRAMRVDKMTLAALAATLRLWQRDDQGRNSIPLLALLTTPVANLENRAQRLAPQLAASPAIAQAVPIVSETFLGGGSVPTQKIPTWCVALTPTHGAVDRLAAELRRGTPAVVGRIHHDQLLLDLRSVPPRDDLQLVTAVAALTASSTSETNHA